MWVKLFVLVIADALQGGNNLDFLCQIASESQMWKSIFLSLPCRDGKTVQLRGSLTSPLGELLPHDKTAKDPGTVVVHYCSGFMRNLSAHLGLFINLWIALSTCTWRTHSRSLMPLCDTDVFSGQFQLGPIPKEGRITKWVFCVIWDKSGLIIFTWWVLIMFSCVVAWFQSWIFC